MPSYCSECYKEGQCTYPCDLFMDWLKIMGECLNGHPQGHDPCKGCQNKGEFDCPLYGPDKESYKWYVENMPDWW